MSIARRAFLFPVANISLYNPTMDPREWVVPSEIGDVEAMAEALVALTQQIPQMLANATMVNRRLDVDMVRATLMQRIQATEGPASKRQLVPLLQARSCTKSSPRPLTGSPATTRTRCTPH